MLQSCLNGGHSGLDVPASAEPPGRTTIAALTLGAAQSILAAIRLLVK